MDPNVRNLLYSEILYHYQTFILKQKTIFYILIDITDSWSKLLWHHFS